MVSSPVGVPGFVLLLEDSEDDAFFLKRAWKSRGASGEIIRVENGLQAMAVLLKELAANKRPRLIITDLKMPQCDGFEFLRWLRSEPKLREIKCMVLSSSSELRDKHEATASGADGFFTKPGDSKAYAAVLDQIETHLAQGSETSPTEAASYCSNELIGTQSVSKQR